MMIPRRISNTLGTWNVVHPFSGKVEFSHTDKELVEAVAAEFAKRSPVGIGWLYDASIMHRLEHGHGPACWVMALATLTWLRLLKGPDGQYLMGPPISPAMPDHLLGVPIVIDDMASGVEMRVATDTRRTPTT